MFKELIKMLFDSALSHRPSDASRIADKSLLISAADW